MVVIRVTILLSSICELLVRILCLQEGQAALHTHIQLLDLLYPIHLQHLLTILLYSSHIATTEVRGNQFWISIGCTLISAHQLCVYSCEHSLPYREQK